MLMRKTCHLCLSSHDEVMYRSDADLRMGFNCLAIAVLETESRLLAEGFLTTHNHSLVQTDAEKELGFRSRYAYSRYFNSKYKRRGRLGEKDYFILEVQGLHHTLAALNYVNRQGLHHGLGTTAFDYAHCSVNAIFRKELGKSFEPRLIADSRRNRYLPANVRLPARYRMDESGLLLREDIIDMAYVKELYISPRSFLWHISKVSDGKDVEEQKRENDTPPITMESIESDVPDFDLAIARNCEYGKVDRTRMTDIELCTLIDSRIIPDGQGEQTTVYDLTTARRERILEWLMKENQRGRYDRKNCILGDKFITERQLRRCLCL